MKINKKTSCLIGIVVGIVIIIIGFSVIDTTSYGIGKYIEFGADFYTEIYDVTKDVGYAINHTIRDLIAAVGWLIICLGAFDICYFVSKMASINDNEKVAVNDTNLPNASVDGVSCRQRETQNGAAFTASELRDYKPANPQFVQKAGVWYCSRCGTENSKNHSQCKKCGTFVTGAMPEVQPKTANTTETVVPVWECAFCGTKNNGNSCVSCGKAQEESQQAKESWVCSKCNAVNSSKYTQCKNCAALRNGTSAKAWEDTTETLIADTWKCDNCGSRNSNKYGQCKKCGTYRA